MSIILHLALLTSLSVAPTSLDPDQTQAELAYPVYEHSDLEPENENIAILDRQMDLIRRGKLQVNQRYGAILKNNDKHMAQTALMRSIYSGRRQETVELIEKHHADVNLTDDENYSPLAIAYENGDLELAGLLLAHGADIHWENAHRQGLFAYACKSRNAENIRHYLAYAPPPTKKQLANMLSDLCATGDIELVRMALNQGVTPRQIPSREHIPILDACESGNIDLVDLLIEHGADISSSNIFEQTCVETAILYGHWPLVRHLENLETRKNLDLDPKKQRIIAAAYNQNPDAIRHYLQKGYPVDTRSRTGETLLELATRQNDLASVRLLVERGADVNRRGERNSTPLHLAATYARPEIISYLLDHHADINARNAIGTTPLILAAISGNTDAIPTLLERGADATVRDYEGHTAFTRLENSARLASHFPAPIAEPFTPPQSRSKPAPPDQQEPEENRLIRIFRQGNELELRKQLNPDTAARETTPNGTPYLHLASRSGNIDAVRLLIEWGADIHARDADGNTALHSVAPDSPDIIDLLILQGADVNAGNDQFSTPIFNACLAHTPKNILALVRHGADLNHPNLNDCTPLMTICGENDYLAIADILIRHGAAINIGNQFGDTPLSIASQNHSMETFRYLLRQGADPNFTSGHTGEQQLSRIICYGDIRQTRLLLQYGADIDATDNKGETALHKAASQGQIGNLILLLQYGVDPNATDNEGNTPLAFSADNPACIHALLAYGADPAIQIGGTPVMNILMTTPATARIIRTRHHIARYKPSPTVQTTLSQLRHQVKRTLSRIAAKQPPTISP